MTIPHHIRYQFYTVQDRRCPICDNEIEYGKSLRLDKPSGFVMDNRCWLLIQTMRRNKGLLLDRAIILVKGSGDGCSGGVAVEMGK